MKSTPVNLDVNPRAVFILAAVLCLPSLVAGQGSPTLPDDLYVIDLANETTTRIGSMGFLGVQGLDYSPSGLLYAWDVSEGLLIVNPITGAATDVNSSVGGTGAIQSIVFAPD